MLRDQQRKAIQEAVSPHDEDGEAKRKRELEESRVRVRKKWLEIGGSFQQGAQVEGGLARQMEPEALRRGYTLREGSRTPASRGDSESACSSPSPIKSSPIADRYQKKTAAGQGGRGDHSAGVGTGAEPEAEAETIAEAAVEDEAEPGAVLVSESGRAQASSSNAATSTAAATSTEVGAGAAPEPAPEVVAGAGAEVATTSETVAAPASVTEAGAAAEDGAGSEPAGGDDVTLRPAAPWSDKGVDFTEKVAEKKAMTNKEADEEDAAISSEILAAEKAMAEDVAKRRAAGEVPPVGTIPFFDNFGQFIRQGLLHPVRRIAPVAVEGYKFRRWSGTVPVYLSDLHPDLHPGSDDVVRWERHGLCLEAAARMEPFAVEQFWKQLRGAWLDADVLQTETGEQMELETSQETAECERLWAARTAADASTPPPAPTEDGAPVCDSLTMCKYVAPLLLPALRWLLSEAFGRGYCRDAALSTNIRV